MCSNVEELSSWGTLKTAEFPDSLNYFQNCWCKLSSDNNQRIVLSVISFQIEPKLDKEENSNYFDSDTNECLESGLYLQSDNKRSKDCTHLLKNHYYISSSKNLFLNYYSRNTALNKSGLTAFWIIYECKL